MRFAHLLLIPPHNCFVEQLFLKPEETLSQSERRLAAIMYADMAGYTALGQRNESLSASRLYFLVRAMNVPLASQQRRNSCGKRESRPDVERQV